MSFADYTALSLHRLFCSVPPSLVPLVLLLLPHTPCFRPPLFASSICPVSMIQDSHLNILATPDISSSLAILPSLCLLVLPGSYPSLTFLSSLHLTIPRSSSSQPLSPSLTEILVPHSYQYRPLNYTHDASSLVTGSSSLQ